jgi:hypothetical protein
MKDYDKQRKLYEATTMVFSKPLYYGGRNFVRYNSITKKYATGNTASTAYSSSAGITIDGVLTKEVKFITKRLENMGYKEHKTLWNQKVDTYEAIRKAGL